MGDVAPGARTAEVFRRRLNELFALGANGRPVTNREVAQWMREHGYAINEAYLSALRGGHRESPSLRVIEGVAAYFGVSPASLVDPDGQSRADLQAVLRDKGVESLALRARGLTPENVKAVTDLVDQIRRMQQLPPIQDALDPTDD
jgi:transcriptional regulator with XRE-family HTH domain